MGIYQDIQDDIKDAMDDDLADAVATLTITETVSSTSYNPVSGIPSSTPVVKTMRCMIVDTDFTDEVNPKSDTSERMIEVMILDSEKTIDFRTGLMASVRGNDYEVMKYSVDPVGATHSLELRGL